MNDGDDDPRGKATKNRTANNEILQARTKRVGCGYAAPSTPSAEAADSVSPGSFTPGQRRQRQCCEVCEYTDTTCRPHPTYSCYTCRTSCLLHLLLFLRAKHCSADHPPGSYKAGDSVLVTPSINRDFKNFSSYDIGPVGEWGRFLKRRRLPRRKPWQWKKKVVFSFPKLDRRAVNPTRWQMPATRHPERGCSICETIQGLHARRDSAFFIVVVYPTPDKVNFRCSERYPPVRTVPSRRA